MNAFETEPCWTWSRVSHNTIELRDWLRIHAAELCTLTYGNHRKYESKQPDDIWNVLNSFVSLAGEYSGPTKLIDVESASGEEDEFDVLYLRLKRIERFGRTGRFDFLVLLLELQLSSSAPLSCYLRGATGPKKGAIKLWGNHAIGRLDYLAMDLSQRLGISPMVIEDALCNWQK